MQFRGEQDHIKCLYFATMDWKEENHSLQKEFVFRDFIAAMAFMINSAMYIEQINHHPEWTNVYNKVSVTLRTHSAGNTVTEKDRELARILDGVYAEIQAKADSA